MVPYFLVYINDIPTVCKTSQANLFADDTLLYQHIRNDENSAKFQEDLNALEDWEFWWQMIFHPEKCTLLRITTNKRYRRETSYFLHGQRLQVTDSAKYLGVTLSDNLQWEKHTQAIAANASRTLGFLRCNFRDCSKQVLATTYKSMVRSTMEYASTSWDPYKTEDVNCLDKVQRRTARYACNNYTERTPGCVTAMVSSLGWESLQDRRKMHRLTMLYKKRHNLVEMPESESIVRSKDSRTQGAQRLFVPYTNVTVYKMSFFPRTIQEWNKLQSTITDIQKIDAFKTALHASIAVQPNKPLVYIVLSCQYWNHLLYILLRGDCLVLTSPWSKLHSSIGFLTCIRKMKMKTIRSDPGYSEMQNQVDVAKSTLNSEINS